VTNKLEVRSALSRINYVKSRKKFTTT